MTRSRRPSRGRHRHRRRRRDGSRRPAAAGRRCRGAWLAGSSNRQPVTDGCSVEPYARTIAMPCAAARSPSAGGTGAPPNPTRRMRRACSGVKSGWSRMLARNTDAPVPAPTSASSMTSSTRVGSQRSIRWMAWPCSMGASTAPNMPVAWVTGDPIRFGDPGVIHARMCSSSASSVRWVCITPLGSLVVPDVYAITQTSSGPTPSGTTASTAVLGAAASTTSHPTRRTRRVGAASTAPTTTCSSRSGSAPGAAPSTMSR